MDDNNKATAALEITLLAIEKGIIGYKTSSEDTAVSFANFFNTVYKTITLDQN